MNQSKINNKIFIVDDDIFFNNLLSYSVKNQLKIDVVCYEKPKDCLVALINGSEPEIIFLDYNFSRYDDAIINGIDVLHKIKKIKPNQSVIMVSSNYDKDLIIKSKKEGSEGYIIKSSGSIINIINLIKNHYYNKGFII